MPISTRGYPTSVGVEPSSKCVRPSTPRRRPKGAGMITKTPKLNRRSFVIGSAAVGAGLALGLKRSEEHTSELQSHLNLVCRLLLEKKKVHTFAEFQLAHH